MRRCLASFQLVDVTRPPPRRAFLALILALLSWTHCLGRRDRSFLLRLSGCPVPSVSSLAPSQPSSSATNHTNRTEGTTSPRAAASSHKSRNSPPSRTRRNVLVKPPVFSPTSPSLHSAGTRIRSAPVTPTQGALAEPHSAPRRSVVLPVQRNTHPVKSLIIAVVWREPTRFCSVTVPQGRPRAATLRISTIISITSHPRSGSLSAPPALNPAARAWRRERGFAVDGRQPRTRPRSCKLASASFSLLRRLLDQSTHLSPKIPPLRDARACYFLPTGHRAPLQFHQILEHPKPHPPIRVWPARPPRARHGRGLLRLTPPKPS